MASDSAVVSEVKEKGGIRFFAEFERHPKGGYKSEMPAWYTPRQVEELKEELKSKEHALRIGVKLPPEHEAELRQQATELKSRITEIEASRPKWTGKQKDELDSIQKELGEQIRDSMYSRDEMMQRLADPHKELKRAMDLNFKIDPDLASAAGVPFVKGKTSREGAIKVWKMIRRGIDPDNETNPEYLRRQKLDGVFHTQG